MRTAMFVCFLLLFAGYSAATLMPAAGSFGGLERGLAQLVALGAPTSLSASPGMTAQLQQFLDGVVIILALITPALAWFAYAALRPLTGFLAAVSVPLVAVLGVWGGVWQSVGLV